MSSEESPNNAEAVTATQASSPQAGEKKSGASLSRLTAAFANMMSTTGKASASKAGASKKKGDASAVDSSYEQSVTPRGIIEAILFVGLPSSVPQEDADQILSTEPNGAVLPAETIAGAMRDVSVEEVANEIEALNQQYDHDAAPYRIETSASGYRMVLREAFQPLRDRFHNRTRSAKLTPAALEVLSIIAYQQPISSQQIADLRDERSTSAINQLLRRGLIQQVKQADDTKASQENDKNKQPSYGTTERFLKLLDLEAIHQLPQVAEHDD